MKICPNPDCPLAKKHGRPGEYVDTAEVCSDCGAALVEAPPEPPQPPRPAPAPGGHAARRLVVTLLAAVAYLALTHLPVFGEGSAMSEGGGASSTGGLKVLSLGLMPFTGAFLFVELLALVIPALRARRVGGKAARAGLDRASWIFGGVLMLAQLTALVSWARAAGLSSPASIAVQLLAGEAVMFALVWLVFRHGLGGGFAMVLGASALTPVLGRTLLMGDALRAGAVSGGSALLMVVLLAAVAVWYRRGARASLRAASPLPSVVPLPVATLNPWLFAAALLTLPVTLENLGVPGIGRAGGALLRSPLLSTALTLFIAFDLALVLGVLFFRPRVVGAIWTKWVPGVDETGVVLAARNLLPRALSEAVALAVAVPLAVQWLAPRGIEGFGGVALALLTTVAWAFDVLDEWASRRRLGPLETVWEVQRAAEVEPIAHLLGTAGIETCRRGLLVRATQQFFAPWMPIAILVPASRAAEARALLEARAGVQR